MIDTAGFTYQDCWTNPAGETVVRPALAVDIELTDIEFASGEFVGCFSILSPNTGEVANYVFTRATTSGMGTIWILNEEYQTIYNDDIGVIPRSPIITYAISNMEIIINSPHFAPLYGVVGGGFMVAEKVASENPNTTAIDIPNGICCEWQGRICIGQGKVLYISDGLAPRTFTGANAIAFPGAIYSLHVARDGTLVLVTDQGLWGLDAEAAATGQLVQPILRQFNNYQATDYLQTAMSFGGLFGLTKFGISQIDEPGLPEKRLSERKVPRGIAEPIEYTDYRLAKLFNTTRGPVVSLSHAWWMMDTAASFASWWTVADGYSVDLVGTLTTREGETVFATRDKLIRAYGTVEYTGQTVIGCIAGQVATPAEASPVIREITTSSDSSGDQKAAVRGTVKTAATPQAGQIIGTDVWSSVNKYEDRAIRSRRHLFAVRTDDIAIEVAAEGSFSRIGLIDLKTKGIGRSRPTN